MKKYLLTALFVGLVHVAFAQWHEDVEYAESPRIGFALQPLVLVLQGIQVDIQPYVRPGQQLVVAPQVYYSNDSRWFFTGKKLDKLTGFGMDLSYRVFPKQGKPFYAAAGGSYNFFKPNYTVYVASEDADIGNWQKINRLGLHLLMGCQVPTSYGFFYDLYGGVGFRHSFVNKHVDDGVNFTGGMWNMAYRGIYLALGVKIGFEL